VKTSIAVDNGSWLEAVPRFYQLSVMEGFAIGMRAGNLTDVKNVACHSRRAIQSADISSKGRTRTIRVRPASWLNAHSGAMLLAGTLLTGHGCNLLEALITGYFEEEIF